MHRTKREKLKVPDFQGFQLLKMARPEEFESPTCRLGGGRSILLSYGRIYEIVI